ncbi:hypothetical protein [Streptomyces sp. NPDC001815]|uniref:hypothetical protein n=1 Tax=Streptomyces sp. NPDC001815 TaxID=3154526 RepID=UPI00332D771F
MNTARAVSRPSVEQGFRQAGASGVQVDAPGVRDASRADGAPYGRCQRRPHPVAGEVSSNRPFDPNLIQEHAMADLAFVVTTIAVFALVALVAKGVTKL